MNDDPKERFSNRVDDYAKYRPTYPHGIIDAILDGFTASVVADLGAGTGISAHLLAERGARVYAIEPNAKMRAAIDPRGLLGVIDAAAEATSLADASVDVVAAFQAYHWFDPDAVLHEAQRIARPNGRFAAVWNHRDRTDLFTGAYESIIDRYDESVGKIDRARRSETVLEDLRRHGWRNVRVVTGSHRRPLDFETLIGAARSASYLPKAGPAYDAMENELRRLSESWPGELAFIYLTYAYLAEAPLVE